MTNTIAFGGSAKTRLIAGIIIAAVVILAGFEVSPDAQKEPHPSVKNHPIILDNNPVQALFVQGSATSKVYMLVGTGGANITIQVGDEGVLVVDTGSGQTVDKTLAMIKHLTQDITDQPIRWIVNTHFHPDSTGGNEAISKAGESLAENSVGTAPIFGLRNEKPVATIVAHENVLRRMSAPVGTPSPTPAAAWPLGTYTEKKEVVFNREPAEIIYLPGAHTDGDSIVFFRHADVISAGGIYVTTSYPVLDLRAGGTINGNIDALNHLIDLTIPLDHQEGGTYVIPGEGYLSDEASVVDYRNMVVIIRDRIQAMMNKGLTLGQVKAAKPTLDYDARYSTPSWTADMFVEAVYRTLTPASTNQGQNPGRGQSSGRATGERR